ncbi:MAG: hypothetical protein WC865_11510 [Bacteroidales bacterium]
MSKARYPVKTLIDPQARVIDLSSSTRSLKLIHRSLLSHLIALTNNQDSRLATVIDGESWDVEYNSTAQLADDIGNYLKNRPDHSFTRCP